MSIPPVRTTVSPGATPTMGPASHISRTPAFTRAQVYPFAWAWRRGGCCGGAPGSGSMGTIEGGLSAGPRYGPFTQNCVTKRMFSKVRSRVGL